LSITALPLASCTRTSSCSWRRQNAWGLSSKAAKSFSISGRKRWISSVRTQTSQKSSPSWRNGLALRCVASRPDRPLLLVIWDAPVTSEITNESDRVRFLRTWSPPSQPGHATKEEANGDYKEWLKTDAARTGELVHRNGLARSDHRGPRARLVEVECRHV